MAERISPPPAVSSAAGRSRVGRCRDEAGIEAGGDVDGRDVPSDVTEVLVRTIDISGVQVEMELVDSETGERIAALVDKEDLGEGAEVGASEFSRMEKFELAKEAFEDGQIGFVTS